MYLNVFFGVPCMAAEYVTKIRFRNRWMAGPDGIYYLVLSAWGPQNNRIPNPQGSDSDSRTGFGGFSSGSG
jgi:hypothetical protein